jgi:hypothetical protein
MAAWQTYLLFSALVGGAIAASGNRRHTADDAAPIPGAAGILFLLGFACWPAILLHALMMWLLVGLIGLFGGLSFFKWLALKCIAIGDAVFGDGGKTR